MKPELPLRQLCDSITRLDGATRKHVAQLDQHIRKANSAVFLIAVALLIVAAINVFFIYTLYRGMNQIVGHMDSMYANLQHIEHNMLSINTRVTGMQQSMESITDMAQDTQQMGSSLSQLRSNMALISTEVAGMSRDMQAVTLGMEGISVRTRHMADGVSIMRENTQQMSGPMGAFNPLMP